jgi:hypothetical protein
VQPSCYNASPAANAVAAIPRYIASHGVSQRRGTSRSYASARFGQGVALTFTNEPSPFYQSIEMVLQPFTEIYTLVRALREETAEKTE